MPEPVLDLDDEEALEFEAAILARVHVRNSAVSVPSGQRLRVHGRTRRPLPLSRLRDLDAHAWAREPSLLSMWARGADVGACANSVTDAMFEPGSPPRTPNINVNIKPAALLY